MIRNVMKLFEKSSIPNHVRIHTDSVVPPSIKRYDGAHTAPVSLATDIRLEGEGPQATPSGGYRPYDTGQLYGFCRSAHCATM